MAVGVAPILYCILVSTISQSTEVKAPIFDVSLETVPKKALAVDAYAAWFKSWKRKCESVAALKRDEFETSEEFAKRKHTALDALSALVFPSAKPEDRFALPTPATTQYDADNSEFDVTVFVTPFTPQGTQTEPIDGTEPARGVDFQGPIIRLLDCKAITLMGQPTFSTVFEWVKARDYDTYQYTAKIPMSREKAREAKDQIRALVLFRRDLTTTVSHTYAFGEEMPEEFPAYKLVGVIIYNELSRQIYVKKLFDKVERRQNGGS